MNGILLGAIGVSVLGLAVPYQRSSCCRWRGSGGGSVAKDALGDDVTVKDGRTRIRLVPVS